MDRRFGPEMEIFSGPFCFYVCLVKWALKSSFSRVIEPLMLIQQNLFERGKENGDVKTCFDQRAFCGISFRRAPRGRGNAVCPDLLVPVAMLEYSPSADHTFRNRR
jgi:hypothetical protein